MSIFSSNSKKNKSIAVSDLIDIEKKHLNQSILTENSHYFICVEHEQVLLTFFTISQLYQTFLKEPPSTKPVFNALSFMRLEQFYKNFDSSPFSLYHYTLYRVLAKKDLFTASQLYYCNVTIHQLNLDIPSSVVINTSFCGTLNIHCQNGHHRIIVKPTESWQQLYLSTAENSFASCYIPYFPPPENSTPGQINIRKEDTLFHCECRFDYQLKTLSFVVENTKDIALKYHIGVYVDTSDKAKSKPFENYMIIAFDTIDFDIFYVSKQDTIRKEESYQALNHTLDVKDSAPQYILFCQKQAPLIKTKPDVFLHHVYKVEEQNYQPLYEYYTDLTHCFLGQPLLSFTLHFEDITNVGIIISNGTRDTIFQPSQTYTYNRHEFAQLHFTFKTSNTAMPAHLSLSLTTKNPFSNKQETYYTRINLLS